MGKASALRRGIVKGIAHTASVVLPKTYHCPICKLEFKAYDVAVEAKETGVSPDNIVAGHVLQCARARFPNMKSECWECHKIGKTKKLTASELNEHLIGEHGYTQEDFK
jgi:hypothetical protein